MKKCFFHNLKFNVSTLGFCLLAASFLTHYSAFSDVLQNEFFLRLQNFCANQKAECAGGLRAPDARDLRTAAMVSDCMAYYKLNGCDDVKALLPLTSRSDIISCAPDSICKGEQISQSDVCRLDGFTLKTGIVSAASGSAAALAAMMLGQAGSLASFGMPILMYAASKSATTCNKDVRFKQMAITIHNLSLLPGDKLLDFNGDDKFLLNYECSDLNKFLQTRADTISLKRTERQRWSAVTPAAQSPIGKALLENLNSNHCISVKAKLQRYCDQVASLVATAVVGGVAAGLTSGGINTVAIQLAKPQVNQPIPSTVLRAVTDHRQLASQKNVPSPIAPASAEWNRWRSGYIQSRPAIDFSSKIPTELLKQYPKIRDQVRKIDAGFKDAEKAGAFVPRKEKTMYILSDPLYRKSNPQHQSAIESVTAALDDVNGWSEYTQRLTIDSANWIRLRGNELEKNQLAKTGEISRRSMLAVLAKRAADRGEKVGKVETLNEQTFLDRVSTGHPFVDKGVRDLGPGTRPHGELTHWLQMDYIAPKLQAIYGRDTSPFYREVTSKTSMNPFNGRLLGDKWEPIMDRQYIFDDGFALATPNGIYDFIGRFLPIANVAKKAP